MLTNSPHPNSTTGSSSGAPSRNQAIDFIRMFALFGICIVNIPFLATHETSPLALPEEGINLTVKVLFEVLLQMKFFLLFSFAFGWGMGVQQQSAARKGRDFAPAWRKRLIILSLLGVAHGILVFEGDILLIYALFGVWLFNVRHWNTLFLKRLVFGLVLFSVCLFAGLLILEDMLPNDINQSRSIEVMQGMAGSFLDAVQGRLTSWPETLVFLIVLQGPLVMAAFTTGLMASKNQLMDIQSASFAKLRANLPALLTVGVVGNLFAALANNEILPAALDPGGIISFMVLSLMPVTAPALALVYLIGIIHLAHSHTVQRWFQSQPVLRLLLLSGRNTLSGYLLQGIIAGLVFGGYGLGWYEQLGYALLLPVSVVIALMSMVLVGWWARRFGTGPFEVLLRR